MGDALRLALRTASIVAALAAALAGAGCAKSVPFHVTDGDSGLPLEGVHIHRHSVSLFSLLPKRRPPAESDFEGMATVSVPPDPTKLTFLRQGYEPTAIGIFRRMPEAMTHADAAVESDPDAPWQRLICWDDLMPKVAVPVVMKPLRSGVVTVRTVDEAGVPIPDCEVLGATFLYLPMPGAEPEWGVPPLERAWTDDDGRAELRSWSGFRNRFTARTEGREPVFADVDGAADASIELRLPRLQWKSQRLCVVDRRGRPVPGALVSHGEVRNGLPAGPHAFVVTTGDDGCTPPVSLPSLEPLTLKVTAPGCKDRTTALLWRSLAEGGTWRIVMERR